PASLMGRSTAGDGGGMTSRRDFVAGLGAAAFSAALPLHLRALRRFRSAAPFPLSVLTDEISQDLGHACEIAAREFGLGYVELRAAHGKNIMQWEAIDDRLRQAARKVGPRGVTLNLENEAACNTATGAEAARLLAVVREQSLKLNWDPGNAAARGETPYPDGYTKLPKDRIAHMHC